MKRVKRILRFGFNFMLPWPSENGLFWLIWWTHKFGLCLWVFSSCCHKNAFVVVRINHWFPSGLNMHCSNMLRSGQGETTTCGKKHWLNNEYPNNSTAHNTSSLKNEQFISLFFLSLVWCAWFWILIIDNWHSASVNKKKKTWSGRLDDAWWNQMVKSYPFQ